MRNGILLAEGAPKDFLAEHGTDTLEAVFLSLCCEQDQGNQVYYSFLCNLIDNIIAPDIHRYENM